MSTRARTGGPDRTALVTIATLSVFLTGFAVFAFYRVGMDRSDFFLFYRSARGWLDGGPLYPAGENPNLNPPLTVAALFGPLARLPYPLAQTVWIAAGVVALVASVRILVRELGLFGTRVIWVLAVLNVTHAAFLVWLQGQLTWVLLYPVTRAWAAWRADRHVAAGLWLGPVIAVKPILALLPLALAWPVWAAAGLASASLTAVGIAWTGWQPWAAWLHLGSSVRWLAWPPNASLWGIAARLQSGTLKGAAIADLKWYGVAGVLVVALLCWGLTVREGNPDRRFVLALFWTLLLSPLGWIYYLPLGLGAMVASWPRGRWIWVAVACVSVPFHMIQSWFAAPLVVRTFGCLYGAAVLLAFWLWADRARFRNLSVRRERI